MLSTDAVAARSTTRQSRSAQATRIAMTEADVLAMGDGEYMNSVQVAFFRSRLLELEQALLAHARGADIQIADCAAGADPVDRASAEEEHTFALTSRARDAAQLLDVRAALTRIVEGEYGFCQETGDAIGVPRLLACPTCVMTVEAQERRENKMRRFRAAGAKV